MIRRRETPAEGRARRAAVDDAAAVVDAAARFLEARARSVGEVRRRLRDAGYRADLIEGAIERLTDLGMLDDAAFARAWVESRDRARPRGARALRDELRRKGVRAQDVEAALAAREASSTGMDEDDLALRPAAGERAESGASDEDAGARLLARRGGPILREPEPRKRRAKAYALLARNGFDPDVCARLATAWLADGVPDPDE
ncbi:MAG: regulatory protein RecX [Chloroflexota bacterium]